MQLKPTSTRTRTAQSRVQEHTCGLTYNKSKQLSGTSSLLLWATRNLKPKVFSLPSIKYCNFTPNFSNYLIIITNFHFPWKFEKSGFHCLSSNKWVNTQKAPTQNHALSWPIYLISCLKVWTVRGVFPFNRVSLDNSTFLWHTYSSDDINNWCWAICLVLVVLSSLLTDKGPQLV